MERQSTVYIVLDVSASMQGEPLQSMRNGVHGLVSALRSNPETCEGMSVTAIAFSTHARVIADSVPLDEFILPDIQAGGSTNILPFAQPFSSTESRTTSMNFFSQVPPDLTVWLENGTEERNAICCEGDRDHVNYPRKT